ncbi:MAG: translocation/assembly module TamB domain-containing protein [Brachymonas sp.]|nr:translocation/assembly module TamB domain-containing protein [Brachymonas sp.]
MPNDHDSRTPAQPHPAEPRTSAVAATPPSRPRRWLRRGLWLVLGLLIVLALALGGLWVWSASNESLNTLLQIAQRHMPAGSSLQVENVSGSLRRGGHIGKLVYRLEEAETQAAQPAANAASAASARSAGSSSAATTAANSGTTNTGGDGNPRGSLTITLEDTHIHWNWAALRHRATQLRRLHVRRLTVADTRAPKPSAEPPKPLQQLTLPVGMDAPFLIDAVHIQRPSGPAQIIEQVQGRYRYDRSRAHHQLNVDSLRYQQGDYSLQATLGGPAPMPLELSARARLQLPAKTESAEAPTPANTPAPALSASAPTAITDTSAPAAHIFHIDLNGSGTLAGADARLQIQAQARPIALATSDASAAAQAAASTASAAQSSDAPETSHETQLDVQATFQPWQQQILADAQAQWQGIDLQAFWPQAPRTALQGQLHLQPQSQPQAESPTAAEAEPTKPASDTANTARSKPAAASDPIVRALGFLGQQRWQATLQASNAAAGPIDQQRLPLHTLSSTLHYHQGHLQLQALDWQPAAPKQAGGRISGQAHYQAAQGWQAQWQVQQLKLAAIHSAVKAEPLQGTIQVKSELELPSHSSKATAPTSTRNAANAPQANNAPHLLQAPIAFEVALQSVPGRDANLLRFDEIQLQGRWREQMAQFSRVLVRSRGGSLQGQASYHTGSQAAQADLALQVPGSSGTLKGQLAPTSGQGQLQLKLLNLRQTSQWLRPWPGMAFLRQRTLDGSAQLQASWHGGWQHNGQHMQIKAQAQAPAITLTQAGSPPMQIRDAKLSLQGRLAQAQLQASGQVQQGSRTLQLAVQGQGGQTQTGWQAQLQALQAQLRDTIQKQQWQADLASPVPITVAQSKDRLQVQTGAFQIRLRGSAASAQEAHIQGEPLRFVQQGKSYQISSRGQLRGLPLAWIETLSGSAALDQALAGDMLFDGAWNVELGQRLQLQAHLARSSGDIVILAGGPAGRSASRVAAGTRTARIDVQSNGSQLEARMDWDSAQAGTAKAQLRTQLQSTASGWTLPGSAPISGQLQARLPRVGIWNMFAPPGWRLRGTLDANITFSGSLHTPLLHGTLNMDDLGVRSIVDGIAFTNGRLRARLNGQRMDIDEFSLQGSPSRTGLLGTQRIGGGSLKVSGHTQWGGGASLLESVRMQLKGQLDQLQLFTLPDRLIVLSGNVNAGFNGLQLTLRGGLRVNRALIELPESSAPKLGDDVVIRPSAKHPKAVLAQPAQAKAAAPSPAPQAAPSIATPRSAAASNTAPTLGDDVVLAPASSQTPAAQAARTASAPQRSATTARQTSKRKQTEAPRQAAATPAASQQAAITRAQDGNASQRRTGSAQARPKPSIGADIQIGIDLGRHFRVRGKGLDTHLNGQLTVKGGPTLGDLPRITGTVNTDRGTFRAYGQDLQIERGRIVFNGAAANPALDIVALRSNLDIRVGVRIYGNAQRPIVQLFSEPPMPDSERLSWLVLGRSSYSAADAALLQQAAMALLSGDGRGITGQLADALGLDDVNFKGGDSIGTSSVTLGKRFSKNFYVAYEKGLDATAGTLYFFLDLSRKLKLRAQTGQQSALDLIYTVSYD